MLIRISPPYPILFIDLYISNLREKHPNLILAYLMHFDFAIGAACLHSTISGKILSDQRAFFRIPERRRINVAGNGQRQSDRTKTPGIHAENENNFSHLAQMGVSPVDNPTVPTAETASNKADRMSVCSVIAKSMVTMITSVKEATVIVNALYTCFVGIRRR